MLFFAISYFLNFFHAIFEFLSISILSSFLFLGKFTSFPPDYKNHKNNYFFKKMISRAITKLTLLKNSYPSHFARFAGRSYFLKY